MAWVYVLLQLCCCKRAGVSFPAAPMCPFAALEHTWPWPCHQPQHCPRPPRNTRVLQLTIDRSVSTLHLLPYHMEVTQECASVQRPGFYCFQGYDRSLPEELIPPSTLPGFSQTLGLHGPPQPLPSAEMLTLTLQCHTSLSGEEQVGGCYSPSLDTGHSPCILLPPPLWSPPSKYSLAQHSR